MNILHSVGALFRGFRSDGSELIQFDRAVAAHDPTIKVESPAFTADGVIPFKYSADGAGMFPPIQWSNIPEETKSLLLVIEDPDAPKPTPFVHGIVFNIPAEMSALSEGAMTEDGLPTSIPSAGIRLGTNSIGKASYMPPSPPPKHGPHRYHFQVIALDMMLDFDSPPTLKQIKDAIANHVVAYGEIVGVYERK